MGRRSNIPVQASPAAIEQVRTLPYTLEVVPLEKMVHRRNFGGRTLQPDKDGLDLLRSISGYGFIADREPVLSEQSDGMMEVVCGNRRVTACKVIRSDQSIADFFTTPTGHKEVPVANRKGITSRVIDTLVCKVYRGITLEQEKILRSDHIGLAALRPWEKFCNVIDLYDAGETLKSIEALTGIKQATVNRLNGIHDLPPEVEEQWFKACHKIPCMGLGQKELDPLHQAWVADRDAMLIALRRGELTEADVYTPPEERTSLCENGRFRLFRQWGEKSGAMWNSFVEAYEASGDASKANPVKTATRKRKDIDTQVADLHASPTIAKVLKWARGEDINLQYVYLEEMQASKDYAAQYEELCKYKEFVAGLTDYVVSLGFSVKPNELNLLATIIVDNMIVAKEEEDIIIEEAQLALPSS